MQLITVRGFKKGAYIYSAKRKYTLLNPYSFYQEYRDAFWLLKKEPNKMYTILKGYKV